MESIEELKKYKQIWEELIGLMKAGEIYTLLPGDIPDKGLRIDGIRRAIEYLQEKYFPKSIKKTLTIEIEAKNHNDMVYALSDIGNFISAEGISKMRIIKEDQCQTTP